MHFHGILAVFERIFFPQGFRGKLAGFADGHEPGVQPVGKHRAEDVPA